MSQQVIYTFDDLYIQPTRLKVVINELDNTPLYSFDGFDPNPDLNVIGADIGVGIQQAGTFAIMIEDSAKTIDTTKFGLGNRVTIYAGKTQDTYQPIITGFCRALPPQRRNTGLSEYKMEGL